MLPATWSPATSGTSNESKPFGHDVASVLEFLYHTKVVYAATDAVWSTVNTPIPITLDEFVAAVKTRVGVNWKEALTSYVQMLYFQVLFITTTHSLRANIDVLCVYVGEGAWSLPDLARAGPRNKGERESDGE
jgi:hypothetical protein